MDTHTLTRIALPLLIIFGLVAVVAGFWFIAPFVIIAAVVLVLIRTHRGQPPE